MFEIVLDFYSSIDASIVADVHYEDRTDTTAYCPFGFGDKSALDMLLVIMIVSLTILAAPLLTDSFFCLSHETSAASSMSEKFQLRAEDSIDSSSVFSI